MFTQESRYSLSLQVRCEGVFHIISKLSMDCNRIKWHTSKSFVYYSLWRTGKINKGANARAVGSWAISQVFPSYFFQEALFSWYFKSPLFDINHLFLKLCQCNIFSHTNHCQLIALFAIKSNQTQVEVTGSAILQAGCSLIIAIYW